MGYRRPVNKGERCVTWQRVTGRDGRRLLRCKAFAYPRRRSAMGFPPGHVPANLGATCRRRKRVFSPWYNKKVWRCASYGPGKPTSARPVTFFGGRGPDPAPSPARRPLPLPPPRPMQVEIIPGYVPLSLPSFERMSAGRTPAHQLSLPGIPGGRRGRKKKR